MKRSTCVIARNESAAIEKRMNSIKDTADEITSVDAGSINNVPDDAEKDNTDFKNGTGFSNKRRYTRPKLEICIGVDLDRIELT